MLAQQREARVAEYVTWPREALRKHLDSLEGIARKEGVDRSGFRHELSEVRDAWLAKRLPSWLTADDELF
jgi:hypothetical protein